MPLLLYHRRLLLLALLVVASHGDSSGDTYNASKCQTNYPCSSLSIRYPFYYAGETGVVSGSSGSYCGYPGLAIQCEGDKTPVLQLGVDKYNVMDINYGNLTISLIDSEVSKEERCPRVDHSVDITAPSWLDLPPDNNIIYLVFLLDCYPSTVQLISTGKITCQGFVVAPGLFSFVLPKDKVPSSRNWTRECRQVIEVPVLKYDPDEPNYLDWGTGGYAGILRLGFQLEVREKREECNRCEGKGSGRCSYNETGGFIGCLCPDGRVNAAVCGHSSFTRRTKVYIIIASSSSVLLLCLLIFTFLGRKKYISEKISKKTPGIESFLQKNGTLYPKRYTYPQVKKMTKSFAEKLGQGGFGAVYRGDLSDGRQVAVKMLKDSKSDGEEFINEVASISRTSHVNVVTLLGFCLEGSKQALIYDYMPNGSLERYAFSDSSKGANTLTWEKLFNIAVGIARGLEYLHRGCNTRVVHFDIKPHNILLDQDFCPKISDFGLAKLCLNKESAISIDGARGTIGYIAPEVYSRQFGAVSSKSDVYSYGMMILEMVGARNKNFNPNSDSSSQYFPQWIYEHLDEYCISASELNGEITEIVRKVILIGLWCIQLSPPNRPTMTKVVEMLEGSTSGLELPPKVLLS